MPKEMDMQHSGSFLIKAIQNPGRVMDYARIRLQEHYYTFIDSKIHVSRDKPVLFVDCGSNIGQGFRWFSSSFRGENIDFHLFEPNPNCIPFLEEIQASSRRAIEVFNKGIGTAEGSFKFYGLADDEGGALSQGGSISKAHNSSLYAANDDTAIDVDVIDFSDYLQRASEKYDQIIVKMDIEGAEIELLEKLIASEAINRVSILYVEFHSQYQSEPEKSRTEAREASIIAALRDKPTKFRVWH